MLFHQITDPKLAQNAYLIGCQQTSQALLVDPERDIDRYLDHANQEGVEIVAVTETHIHADFLSGAREFAERYGAKVYLSDEGDEQWRYKWIEQPAEDGSTYDYDLLSDGDVIEIGNVVVTALHTPGHTPEHLSFLITDTTSGPEATMGLISGDFVFVGDLGRPDLLESVAQEDGTMEPSARRLYDSVQRFLELPDHLQVWPGHGAGSACGKALGAVPQSTVGFEKQFNPMIQAAQKGEEAFVEAILEDQPAPQTYFARMKRDNKAGPPLLGSLPNPGEYTVQELDESAQDDEVLFLDTRPDRSAFMTRHVPGALFTPLTKSFNTVVGSLVEDETVPIVLLVPREDLEEAVRDLVRIGYDNIVGFAVPETVQQYLDVRDTGSSIDEITFAEVEALHSNDDTLVLDVRYQSEYEQGHVEGAVNAPYTRLPEYARKLPSEKTVLVHCASGARAAYAAAYLHRTGRSVKYVNDSFARYEARERASTVE